MLSKIGRASLTDVYRFFLSNLASNLLHCLSLGDLTICILLCENPDRINMIFSLNLSPGFLLISLIKRG